MKKTYKQLSEELDTLMSELQDENGDIDESIAKYKQATELIGQMEEHLKKAKVEISKIGKAKK